MKSSNALIGETGRAYLSPEDDQYLQAKAADVSDIDQSTMERAYAGFNRAYEIANLVVKGDLDPLSA